MYIAQFALSEVKKYPFESEHLKLVRIVLQRLMKYYPENIQSLDKIDYFITDLLDDFDNVIKLAES